MSNLTPCPHCQVPTPDLKQLRIWRRVICAVVYVRFTEYVETACPNCMKRALDRSLIDNVLTANLAWPAMLLLYIPRYMSLKRPGPSVVVSPRIAILHDVGRRPTNAGMFRSVLIAVLIAMALCGLGVALGGKHNDPAGPAGWICFGISMSLLASIIIMAVRRRGDGQ